MELLSSPLFNPKNDSQKLLYLLRGIAFHGMRNHLFNQIFVAQGEAVTTFKVGYDSSTSEEILFIRNNPAQSRTPFIEIDFQEGLADKFMEAYSKVAATEGVTSSEPRGSGLLGEGGAEALVKGGIDKPIVAVPVEPGATPAETITTPWSPKDQELWLIARGKNAADYSLEEKAVMEKHKALAKKVAEIGIEQPGGERTAGGQVIERETALSESEQTRLAQLEEAIPGIAGLVDELEKNIPRQTIEESPEKNEHEKYLEWRESGDFYGRLGEEADYLTGRTLIDLLNENSQAEIDVIQTTTDSDPKQSALTLLQARLKDVVDRLAPEDHVVNDFEIVVRPEERELAQLGLLKTFIEVATGMKVSNDLFLYEGTGVRGINLSQKAIGLHRALTRTSFGEAMGTFGHEVAHNVPEAEDHGIEFRHAMQAIFTTTIEKFADISGRALLGEQLTSEERVLLDIRNQWENLRVA